MRRRRVDTTFETKLVCSICGSPMYIARRRRRAAGHVKHMYCYKCKTTQAFIECDRYEQLPETYDTVESLRVDDSQTDHPVGCR